MPTPGDPARLVDYQAAVDAQVECLRRLGYEVTADQTEEHDIQVGAIVPAEVAPEDEKAFDEWMSTYDRHRDGCRDEADVAKREAAYLSTLWVEGSDREQLWQDFIACVEEEGLPVPKRGLSEQGVNDVLLSQGEDGKTMQSLLDCRAKTAGLWPSLTKLGDQQTTIIIA
ncbi:MAG: hypothetical protein QM713_11795 [Arachnia sp.]